MNQELYNIDSVTQSTFVDLTYKHLYCDRDKLQMFPADMLSTGSVTNTVFFDSKFSVNTTYSLSSLYNSIAYSLRTVKENGYDKVFIQNPIGIWKLPSTTGNAEQEVAQRIQYFGISNYHINDEIANGTFRLYYLPLTGNVTGSTSAQINQKTLKFLNINDNVFGPSLAITSGTGLLQNLSGTTTSMSVEMFIRPQPQVSPGFLFHRWTSFDGHIVNTYNEAGQGTLSANLFYSAHPYYGVGCYINKWMPRYTKDEEPPYMEFYVYGALSGTDSHYLNLYTGKINQNTHTRFLLNDSVLNKLFDGNFHNIKCVWSIADYYKHGRIYIDGNEVEQSTIYGDGRNTAVSYSLSGSVCSTPMYFLSKMDDTLNPSIQKPSLYSTFGEVKHTLIYNIASSATYVSSASTSNTTLINTLGSVSSNIGSWFWFNSANQYLITEDLTQPNSIRSVAVSGTIVNDTAVEAPEGKIDRIYSLFFDKRDDFVPTILDDGNDLGYQKSIGRIYNNEYGVADDISIGYIVYPKGNVFILNDGYNRDLGIFTQKFVTSPSGQFLSSISSTAYKTEYVSFASTTYTPRKILSVTAQAQHFAKSTNITSLFQGKDGNIYTKSNKKFVTGIVWYGPQGKPLAITKFSEPIFKNENESLSFNIVMDF